MTDNICACGQESMFVFQVFGRWYNNRYNEPKCSDCFEKGNLLLRNSLMNQSN